MSIAPGAGEREPERVEPHEGDFIPPPEVTEADERADALPQQEDFWRPPVRFGTVPLEKEPLGWDRRQKFCKWFPYVSLPTQVVERVSSGHPELKPNRLFWGDSLHVMRQLSSESIDLIYVDPPVDVGADFTIAVPLGDEAETVEKDQSTPEMVAYRDMWRKGTDSYLYTMYERFALMNELLAGSGSIEAMWVYVSGREVL